MVLEAVFADESQQLLHLWNLYDACATEGMQRIVCKRTLTDIAFDLSIQVGSRESRKAHGACLHGAVERSMGILLANRSGNDLLVIHLHAFVEDVFRQVRAVEADCVIWVITVVMVPMQQGA